MVNGVDLVLTFTMGVLGSLFAILWYFIRKQFETDRIKHDKHFAHAAIQSIHQVGMNRETIGLHFDNIRQQQTQIASTLAAHINTDEHNMERVCKTLHWVCDSMMTIAAALKVQLPPRPE